MYGHQIRTKCPILYVKYARQSFCGDERLSAEVCEGWWSWMISGFGGAECPLAVGWKGVRGRV
jgi:hypothetical protein